MFTGSTSMNDFLAESDIETENGRMVLDIIERISETWGEEIPKEYKRFIANVCKQSSVAGLLQVTSNLSLIYLESFCQETLDIRSVEEDGKLGFIQKEMPAFWPMLTSVLDLEGSKYLPIDVQHIVLKLTGLSIVRALPVHRCRRAVLQT